MDVQVLRPSLGRFGCRARGHRTFQRATLDRSPAYSLLSLYLRLKPHSPLRRRRPTLDDDLQFKLKKVRTMAQVMRSFVDSPLAPTAMKIEASSSVLS